MADSPTHHDHDILADVIKGALERDIDVPHLIATIIREQAKPRARALLDNILKARQLLLRGGCPADSLSVRLHPYDYQTLGLEVRHHHSIDVDEHGAPSSVMHMPLVQDLTIAIGAPSVCLG